MIPKKSTSNSIDRSSEQTPRGSSPKPEPENMRVSVTGVDQGFSFDSQFLLGHGLWLKRDYSRAFKVFDLLSSFTDRGPRASIFKAHCAALEGRFSECSASLFKALPNENFDTAAVKLHDIFVLWKFKLFNEVRRDLEQFVAEFPGLPTPALLLGEFFSRAGQHEKAINYFQMAYERDCGSGVLAKIAEVRQRLIRRKT